jgi:carbon-monoxide dehydrogenase medium subunit/xanthine dehydrogenase FAD-binding subunit
VLRGGCLGRYPLPFTEAEEYLLGKKLDVEVMSGILQILHDKVYEINKYRVWSVFYKKESVQGVFKKLIADVAGQLGLEGGGSR